MVNCACVIVHYRHVTVFLAEADFLEKSLGLVTEVLEIMLSVQRQHVYLEVSVHIPSIRRTAMATDRRTFLCQSIFAVDNIRQKMPIESIDYDILTEEWKEITADILNKNNLFKACYSKCV